MAVQINQLDLGKVYRDVAAVQGAQRQNALFDMMVDDRKAAAEQRGTVNALMQGMDFSGGLTPQNVNQLGAVAQVDPERAFAMTDWLAQLDDIERQQTMAQTEDMARQLLWVQQAPESERPERYAQLRDAVGGTHGDVALSMFPEQYDPAFVEREIFEARTLTDILNDPAKLETLTPEEKAALELPEGALVQRDPETGKLAVVYTPPQGNAPRDSFSVVPPEEVAGLGFQPGTVIQRNNTTGQLSVAQQPQSEQGITPQQEAGNQEIIAARQYIEGLGLDREGLLAATREQTATGRENPDYDPFLAKQLQMASQPLVGVPDPDYAGTYASLYGGGNQGNAQPQPLPVTADGQPDPAKLEVGVVYETSRGLYRWDGQQFMPEGN